MPHPEFRRAKISDAPFVAGLVREFYVGKDFHVTYGIEFDYQSTLATVTSVIENGVCLVGDAACAGATIYPFPFNHAIKIGYVNFWYFVRPSGIKIFADLMKELRSSGANRIWAVSHAPIHKISKHYRKKGLRLVESIWS